MRSLSSFAVAFLIAFTAFAQQQPSAESRLAAQNALFAEYWETNLKLNPTLATQVGDYRYNNKLGDFSLAAIARRHDVDQSFLTRIKAISTDGFGEEDRTSHDLLVRRLQESADDWDLKNYEMPVGAMGGPHTGLADLPNAVPLDSVKHYDDYIARLHQIPTTLLQTEEVLRQGVKDHLVVVKFLAEKIPAQANGIIASNPFITAIKKMPATFSDADKKRLTDEITTTVEKELFPAFKQFASFIATDYAPNGRT